ncbi:aspartate aminotransferase [Rhodopirellula baltica SH 1]|uniref:Aminotransferase n=2 Tax=Rhodopirellula baltica TaxID=265606 RepID=Q7UG06_RHOBA|nr:aspartate aminotransferase [Rhodopirellula baltica SH 1]
MPEVSSASNHRFQPSSNRQRVNMHPWIADRTASFDSSGIRKVFDLAAKLKDPINLSIGQPDFDVPEEIQDATVDAIRSGKNAYSPTQGIAPLREKLLAEINAKYPGQNRDVFVSSGTSGGLVLSLLSMINPGDEVIFLDPYFVMYPALVSLCGGIPVTVDSYPDFRLDPAKIEAAITPKTKMILVNSPANPTGVTASEQDLRDVGDLAAKHNIALLSDEIYSRFFYDGDFASPAATNPDTIVIDGFSKSHAMTGWRVGYVHGPPEIIATMLKIQQYSFVCSPQPAQWGALRAMEISLDGHIDDYRRKRDFMVEQLSPHFELTSPGGAFYLFPKAPGTEGGTAFVERAIADGLLIIPGKIFSSRDSHFRVSFAASDDTLRRGAERLIKLAGDNR